MTDFSMKTIPTLRTIWMLHLTLISVSFLEHAQADCASHLKRKSDEISIEWEGQCYIYDAGLPGCEDMFTYCERRGGFGVKIVSLEQQKHFYREIINKFYEGISKNFGFFWIGLKYDKNIGYWKWDNGDPVTWTNWKTRPKETSCLAVRNPDGIWEEHDASNFADGYLCHMREQTTMSFPTTIPTKPSTTTILTSTDAQTTAVSTTLEAKEVKLQQTPGDWMRPQETRKQMIYEALDAAGDHLYLQAQPSEAIKSWSPLACCSKCSLLAGCWVINYNKDAQMCRLFVKGDVLEHVVQKPGWIVFQKKLAKTAP